MLTIFTLVRRAGTSCPQQNRDGIIPHLGLHPAVLTSTITTTKYQNPSTNLYIDNLYVWFEMSSQPHFALSKYSDQSRQKEETTDIQKK